MLLKLLVGNSQTSAENFGNFTAEVAEVLWCVFQTSCKEVIFSCFFLVIRNYFITLQGESLSNSLGGDTFVSFGNKRSVMLDLRMEM